MMRPTSPTLSRRWIAREMKRLRLQAGLQQGDVAKELGCRVPKVSLIENGQRPVQDDDLKKLVALFVVPEDEQQFYFDQLANAHRKGWWEQYDEAIVPSWLVDFTGLEDGAKRIRAYHPAIMHGLLQTRDYSLALFRAGAIELSEERISRKVEFRQARQERVLSDHACRVSVVLDEAVLHHVVGDHATMRAQLEHVVKLCRCNPAVSVRVVPFEGAGAYEAGYGAFTVLTSPLPRDPGVVYLEHRDGARYLESLEDIDVYSRLFDHLVSFALPLEESLDKLQRHARTWG